MKRVAGIAADPSHSSANNTRAASRSPHSRNPIPSPTRTITESGSNPSSAPAMTGKLLGPMLGGMEILASRILLHPADLDRSLRFYGETIGLAIYREWGSGPSRGVAFFLGGGGVLEVSGGSPQPPSGATELVLQVRDLRATYALLVERGVTPEGEPELKPWGLLEMTVHDPDGLALIFVEVPPEHPRRKS
jgi:catechol 2,3-dioxygenase-like lactoylglutathione lyase family enzyme